MGISYGTTEQLHRERRKQRTHPERRMSRTHRYEMNATVPTTTALGANTAERNKPWTFGFSLFVDSSKGTPIGTIFECGGAGDGFAIVLENGRLGVAAGDGTNGDTTNGLYVETARLFDTDGQESRVLVAVDPARSRVAVWRDGVHLELSGDAALFGEWGQYWARPSSGFTSGLSAQPGATGQDFTADNTSEALTVAGHGYQSGEGTFVLSTTGTLPTGLSDSTQYWVEEGDEDTLFLHLTRQAAIDGDSPVAFSDDGTGTHTLTPAIETRRWCGDNDGGVGARQSTMTNQPSTAAQADLVGAQVVRFSIYRGQLPPFRAIP